MRMLSKRLSRNITIGISSRIGLISLMVVLNAGIGLADEPKQKATSNSKTSKAATPDTSGEPQQTPYDHLKKFTTKSLVNYWDIKKGTGKSLESSSRMRVHSSGWLLSGELFWSSHTKGKPFIFNMDQVIPGWREGLIGMKEGGVRRLDIPSTMAYGAAGRGNNIPPNSDLIFEVELIEVLGLPTQTSVKGIEPVTTASGLKYWDIKVGTGASPSLLDRAELHYSGWLSDGTLFDSSITRNEHAKFKLNRVIAGWSEGLESMKVGGVRRLEIPAKLAYGEQGKPPTIPANADLVFEIELFKVLPAPKQRSTAGITPVTTESGLQYWDIKTGDGDQPTKQSWVQVHYSGWLENGTLFDSSIERGVRPARYRLDQVIPGWTEGVLGMKVGGIRHLKVPPDLAYGAKGQVPAIPPNTTLIFDITLLGVTKPPQQTSVKGIKPVMSPSGLKYWDIKFGDGEEPQATDTVMIHYTGWLENGKLIDSSVVRGGPVGRTLEKLMTGLSQGISTMRVGGKRRLEIPYNLAFGEAGNPPHVPFRANVVYEVELLDIIRK